MSNYFSQRKTILIPAVFTFFFAGVLTILNLQIGLRILHDPTPFQSSYWDARWAALFAVALAAAGALFFIRQYRLLLAGALLAAAALVILPVFTTGAGLAYLMLLLLVLIGYGAGEWILKILLGDGQPSGWERFPFALLLGLGLLMVLVMVQGFIFAFHPLVTWLGVAVLAALFVVPNLKHWFVEISAHFRGLNRFWKGSSLQGWALAAGLLLILLAPSWLIALAPANRYDEMTYHLAAPMFYLQKGGIVPYPEGGLTYWMHYAEMLYTLALQTAGQPLPRLLELMMGMLSTLLTFLFARRLAGTRVGVVSAILFIAVPVVGYETSTAYIDLFVTAYTTAFGLALLIYWQERNPRWLLAAGVIGGLGWGIKISAGLIMMALAGVLLLGVLWERKERKHILWLGAMSVLILALALPWLIRDALWTGDPFFPYGRTIIPGLKLTVPTDVSTGGPLSSKVSGWIRYPVDLVFNSFRYYHEAAGGMASALPLLAAPLFLFSGCISRPVKQVGFGVLAASVVTAGLMFVTNNALLRYAIPIFPWLALGTALNIEGVYGWLAGGRWSKWGTAALLLVGLVYLFSTRLPLIVRPTDNLPQRFPVNFFLGRENRDAFLSRTFVVYDAYRFIDSQPGGPHRVLSIGNEFRLYTQSRIDGVYDVKEAGALLSTAQTAEGLAQSLERAGYDYILINQPEADFRPAKYIDPYPILKTSDFLSLYTEIRFVENGVYVYRIKPAGSGLPPAQNLLKNPGFEEVTGGKDFSGWDEFGLTVPSNDAHQGSGSVMLYGPTSPQGYGYVFQKTPVDEEQFYTLGYWLKSDHQAIFLMQVRWLDSQGFEITRAEMWKNTTSSWQWYSLLSQAPKGARYAEVYASAGGGESVLVDDVCLARGQGCPAR